MQKSVARICLGLHASKGAVVAGFDGGKMTSEAGALLLGATDRAIRLVARFAACFADSRTPELTRFGAKHQEAGLRTLLL